MAKCSAECNVMPLMLNAATPVGAVSNTMVQMHLTA